MAYAQRLERDADPGVKEAFRVLHQGLSCLAGQISATDNHSAHVAAQLTNSWEQMARRLCEMEAELDESRRGLDARLSVSEKTGQYTSSALEHALEKIEAFARQRATDQAENLRQTARHEQLLERLSEALARLEKKLPDASLALRVDALDQAVAGLAEPKKPDQSTAPLLAAVQALTHRLEALEKDHAPQPAPAGASEPVQNDPGAVPDFEDIFAGPEPANVFGPARMPAPAAPGATWPRYLVPLGLLVVLALGAGFLLQQRTESVPVARTAPPQIRTYSLPEPPSADDTQFVVGVGGQAQNDENNPTQRLDPDAPPQAHTPLKQRASRNPALKSPAQAKAVAPKTDAAVSHDRVAQLAAQGNVLALTILGFRAADGTDGVTVNWPDAVKYLSQAAEKGQAMAQYRLGTLYEHGQGVAMDPLKAAHWYELSAAQGNRKAMHNLAVFYASRKDMTEAARWFAKAAALGLADSQFNLAILYEHGDGVPQSLADAFKWYAIAAGAGDAESRTRMGLLQNLLSDADKAAAAKAAQAFHPLSLDPRANLAPQSSDLTPS